jgi:hypothetical protein
MNTSADLPAQRATLVRISGIVPVPGQLATHGKIGA